MDAGPNVKILTKDQVKYVLPIYEQYASVIVCHKGEGLNSNDPNKVPGKLYIIE